MHNESTDTTRDEAETNPRISWAEDYPNGPDFSDVSDDHLVSALDAHPPRTEEEVRRRIKAMYTAIHLSAFDSIISRMVATVDQAQQDPDFGEELLARVEEFGSEAHRAMAFEEPIYTEVAVGIARVLETVAKRYGAPEQEGKTSVPVWLAIFDALAQAANRTILESGKLPKGVGSLLVTDALPIQEGGSNPIEAILRGLASD